MASGGKEGADAGRGKAQILLHDDDLGAGKIDRDSD